jgi:hypothetical protein
MTEQMTRQELADKVDWEGGVEAAINGYGLDTSVLPDDTPAQIRADWQAIQDTREAGARIQEWLDEAYGE